MYLKADKVTTIKCDLGELNINERIINDTLRASKFVCDWINKGELMKPCKPLKGGVQGITIHNTNEIQVNPATTMSEQYARATYNCNMRGSVVHYYVDTVEAWQLLKDTEQGWHAGDGDGTGNSSTIAIEGIGYDSLDNVALLTAYLCVKHNLNPLKQIYTHQHWSGKFCPEYFLPDWDNFLDVVMDYYNSMTKVQPVNNEVYNYITKNKISDGTRPKDYATREEVWTMLYRLNR